MSSATRGLDLLETFLAVAEELNFRRAAQRLHLDQSALSRRIRKLEQLVGFQVLERTTRAVSLTAAGRTFYDENKDLLGGYARSVDIAKAVAQGHSGSLTIAYMAFAAVDLMPRTVVLYRERRANVALNLKYVRTQGQKLLLAQGDIDIGFMIGPLDRPDFDSVRLASDRLCLVAPAGHPAVAKTAVRAESVTDYPLILGDMGEWEFYRLRLDALFGRGGAPLQVAFQTSNILAVMGLVRAGLGVTILPESLLPTLQDGLEARPLHPASMIESVMAWSRDNTSPLVRDFVEIAAELARERPLAKAGEPFRP